MTLTSLIAAAVAFAVGYLLGRTDLLMGALRNQASNAPQGFFAKTKGPAPTRVLTDIAIDERKVVSQIKTDTLQNVTQVQLGKQVVAQDDINASVSKLAQLKRS